jgi:hypothetical protein
MGSPDFWRLVGVVGFFRDVVSGRAVQGSRVGLGGIRFLRVWHDCVRLCAGRCRVGRSVLVDSRIDSRAGHELCVRDAV